nr:4-(cytidine 5'-diphospho)-2-C-methyl-D-erythritol kinase [uncultured Eisenbergiella sp.]
MEEITLKAMAKINLGLDVIRRREDGYHEVRMIMQTVNLYDELTFRKQQGDRVRLTTNLRSLPTDGHNLIVKTVELLRKEFGIREGLSVHLKKKIPVAAGMAGGSTDAAAAFAGMNELFGLGLTLEELQKRAVSVGADVPYCLQGGTALSEGIGEILTALPPAPRCSVIIAKPPIHVSTRFVYENLHLDSLEQHPDIDGILDSIRGGSIRGVAERLENVLETVTQKEYPVIGQIKQFLVQRGALGALMSGSGPTVFALYDRNDLAARAYEELRRTGLAKQVYLTSFSDKTCIRK